MATSACFSMATILGVRHGSPVRGCFRLVSSLFAINSVRKEATPLPHCYSLIVPLGLLAQPLWSPAVVASAPLHACKTATSAALSASDQPTLASLFSLPLVDVCLAFSPPSSSSAAAKVGSHSAKPVNDKHVTSTSPVTVPLHVLIMQAVAIRCSLRRQTTPHVLGIA